MIPHPASFRDPAGYVTEQDGRVFRIINRCAQDRLRDFREENLFRALVEEGKLIAAAPPDKLPFALPDEAAGVLEHPRIPVISYPFEWPFALLKAAALLHLDIQLRSLDAGFVLTDASAYNIQFIGPRPIFIDWLSFRRYRDNEPWYGYRQFCEQFLNPLLYAKFLRQPYHAWYRGTLTGLPIPELAAMLPLRARFSVQTLVHVSLHAVLQRRIIATGGDTATMQTRLPRARYRALLKSLSVWIETMKPPQAKTAWSQYEREKSYSDEENRRKHAFIAQSVKELGAKRVWDLGCNAGEFSRTALQAGAACVVGTDADSYALNTVYARAREENLPLLPLWQDVMNPSVACGWRERERAALQARLQSDCLLALALLHHLCIANNVPLPDAVAWLVSLAPQGVIEFVPKQDPMAQRLLRMREDIFDGYTIDRFREALSACAVIEREEIISITGRTLFLFKQKN